MNSKQKFIYFLTICLLPISAAFSEEESAVEEVIIEEVVECEEPSVCLSPLKGKASLSFHNHTINDQLNEFFLDGKMGREAFIYGNPFYKWSMELESEWKRKGASVDSNGKPNTFIDKGFYRARYEQRFAPSWVWRAEHETRWGKRENLHYRLSNGLGLGYYLFDACDFTLQPMVMIRHINANYRNNEKNLDQHGFWPAVGWDLSWTLPFCIQLTWEAECAFSVSETNRQQLYSDLELSVPCGMGWSIDLEYESIYRSQVAASEQERYDGDFRIKFSYCF